MFLWMCAFGAVYKSNTLFQKILFSWAASTMRKWYSFSRSSSHDKTLRKKVRERLPKLICQQDHSISCLQNFKTKLHYNSSNSMFSKKLEISILKKFWSKWGYKTMKSLFWFSRILWKFWFKVKLAWRFVMLIFLPSWLFWVLLLVSFRHGQIQSNWA